MEVKTMPEQVLDKTRGYSTAAVAVAMVATTFVTGVIYVSLEWTTMQEIRDSVFVSLLIAATMILVLGIRTLFDYLERRGLAFYSFVLAAHDPGRVFAEYREFYLSVTNARHMTLAGILYGFAIGSVPFVLGVWQGRTDLTISLAVFLFSANFATGVAFYSLLIFFRRSLSMGLLIRVNLFHIENPSTSFLLGATRRISVLASAYISIALTSILFSELPVGGLVIAYAIFALAVLLASLVIPLTPIVQRLNEAKANHLGDIDGQIDILFQDLLQGIKDGRMDQDLSKLALLLQLKERIQSIDVIPFKVKSIAAAVSVILLSAIPVGLQLVLTKLFG